VSTNTPPVDDEYVVKLPSGDARVMSVEELDAALEAGTIHGGTPVLAPGTTTWTTLGVLAGLDDVATPGPSSVMPPSPSSLAPMMLAATDDLAVADDDDPLGLRRRRRGAKVVGLVFGAAAVFAIVFGIQGAIRQSIASSAAQAALAAQPPAPPPPAAVPLPAPRAPVVEAAPPPPAPSTATAPATSKPTAMDKDKKKGKLPSAPKKKK
jgi:hypothetical protein